MPKMQVRGTQSFFGDVQDVRYAENAGTWYPEQFFGDVYGWTLCRQCMYVVPRAIIGAPSVLRRRIFGNGPESAAQYHSLTDFLPQVSRAE